MAWGPEAICEVDLIRKGEGKEKAQQASGWTKKHEGKSGRKVVKNVPVSNRKVEE